MWQPFLSYLENMNTDIRVMLHCRYILSYCILLILLFMFMYVSTYILYMVYMCMYVGIWMLLYV